MPTRAAFIFADPPYGVLLRHVLLLAAFLAPAPASAQTAVEQGSVGSIVIPIEYGADAESDASGVVLVPNFPLYFTVGFSTSPLTLGPGQVRYLSFPYLAGGGQPAPAFPVTFSYPELSGVWERESEEALEARFEVVPPAAAVDSARPVTSLVLDGASYDDGSRTLLSSTAVIRLAPGDPLTPLSAASGIAATRYLLDTVFVDTFATPGTLYAGEAILPPGPAAFTLSWYSVDNAGNVELLQVASMTVDSVAPAIAALSPSGGELFGAARTSFTVAWAASDNLAPFVASGALVQVEDRGTPLGTAPAQVPVSLAQVVLAANLDDGLWELRVFAEDFVLNTSSRSSGQFEIVRAADALPPRTTLLLGTPTMLGVGDGTPIISAATRLTLSAVDDGAALGDGAGVGVAVTSFSVNTPLLDAAYSAPFTLPGGPHILRFRSADFAGNHEDVHVASVAVDAVPAAVTRLTPAEGTLSASSRPALLAAFADFLSGLSTGSITLKVDGQTVSHRVFPVPGGSFGPWQAAPPLPTATHSHRMIGVGNYVYSIGGVGTGFVGAVNVASVTAQGTLSPWTTTSPLSYGSVEPAAVSAGNFLFAMPTSNNRRIDRLTINPNGTLSPPTTVGEIPGFSTEYEAALANCGRYLYVFLPDQGQAFSTPVDANGNIGTWKASPPMPRIAGTEIVEWAGRIYMVGGRTPSGLGEVYATVGAGDGVIDSWERMADMPEGRHEGALTVLNGRLVYVGGRVVGTDAPSNSVFVGISSGGAVSSWTTHPFPYPSSYYQNAVAAVGDMIVGSGGRGVLTGGQADAWSMRFSSDGRIVYADARATAPPLQDGLHTLQASGSDQFGLEGTASTQFTVDATPPLIAVTADGRTMPAGGFAAAQGPTPLIHAEFSDLDAVAPATVRLFIDGIDRTSLAAVNPQSLSFAPPTALSPGLHTVRVSASDRAGNAASVSGMVLVDTTAPNVSITVPQPGAVVGGEFTVSAAAADQGGLAPGSAAVALSGEPLPATASHPPVLAPGEWRPQTALPVGVRDHRMVQGNGFLYTIGGHKSDGSNNAQLATVHFASVSSAGAVGAWTRTTDIPEVNSGHAAAAAKGRVYVLGHFGSPRVVHAQISTTGHLGSWSMGPTFPMPFNLGDAAVTESGGFLYAISYTFDDKVRVFVLPLSANGTPGAWFETTPFGQWRYGARLAVRGDRIFLIGGQAGYDVATTVASVQVADIRPDGTLSPWRAAKALPEPRSSGAVVVVDGVLAYVGGDSPTESQQTRYRRETFVAPFESNGEPLAWISGPDYPQQAVGASAAAAAAGSTLFVSGGHNSGPAYSDHYSAAFTDRASNMTVLATANPSNAGPQTLSVNVRDASGNISTASLSVTVDLTPPETGLAALGSSLTIAGILVTAPGTPFELRAFDATAGVSEIFRSLDGGALIGSSGEFTVPAGPHSLSFWSVDSVANRESVRTVQVKVDGVPPAAISGLVSTALSSHSIRLSWTSPGDDGSSGDIHFAQARVHISSDPGPASTATAHILVATGTLPQGTELSTVIDGLSAGTSYYAAVFTRDSIGNWSTGAPLTAARTFLLVTSSDAVAALATPSAAEITVVSTTTGTEAYSVAVASQALSLLVGDFYHLTDGLTFAATAPAILSFYFNPLDADLSAIAIYTFDEASLTWSSASISNQTITFIANDLAVISGQILHTSLYAPLVRDTVAPLTVFTVSGSTAVFEGRTFALGPASGILTAVDLAPLGGNPSGVERTLLALDSAEDTVYRAAFALPEGRRHIEFHSVDRHGNIEVRHATQVYVDATAPAFAFEADVATFSVPGGFGTLTSTVNLTLRIDDPERDGAFSGLAVAAYWIDGTTTAFNFVLGAQSSVATASLGPGLHALAVEARDRLGNHSELTFKIAVGDTESPVTTLTVGAPKANLPNGAILVSAASGLTLAAEDSAESGTPSGVASVYSRFGAEPFALYSGSFSVPSPAGGITLEFYAVDRAGNAEHPPKSQALVLDEAPPAVALRYPQDVGGICRLAQGRVAVRGSVTDPHLARWELSDSGVYLGSGTADADGLLGFWDAAGRTGPVELRLSAADLVDNAASLSLSVHAGEPARVLALGGREVLNKPRGVATGPNRIYVADTNADRVRVFDAAGVALAVLGEKKGAAKLNKPAGLALDAAGNILVADANNKRVVKLSPAGAFLAEYGKGLLKRPMAVALSLGRVVVADAKSGQLAVFDGSGPLLTRVELPGVPQSGRRDDDDDDEEEEPRPMALAADAAGNVWVADAKGGRVLRYAPDLTLAQTVPGFRRPEGVAVTPSGACLAVSDAKDARIRTFDAGLSAGLAAHSGLAAFGVRGEIKEHKPLPAEFFLNKPAQLAFRADGTLLAADRNNDLVQGFGLPGAPVVVAIGKPRRPGHGGTRLASADGGSGEVVASARVGRLEGGRVEHPDGAAVEVPAGAISADLDVAVAKAPDSGDGHRVREAARGSAGLAAASGAREFSPHGLNFSEPAVITLPYDPLLAAAPRELRIHYWNEERGAWEALASTVDEGARTVSARVAHFSVYQVLAPAGAISTMADPDSGFAFRAVYAFPNPAVGGQKPAVHVAVGRADKVTVRFYDVAGTPVHEAALDTPSVVNDESGPHWAYEHAWNGHIPSGVYIYSVTAEKAGHAPIKRVGKLAVVR